MMDVQDQTIDPALTRLLSEAAEWRLLGLLFEYPSEAWRQQVSDLTADLTAPALREMAAAALDLSSEGLHSALFGPGGTVSIREVTYQGGVQFGYLMAELSACYDAFGYRPATSEADDNLSVEAGFMAWLKLKEAYALSAGDAEHAAITADAAARFLKEHLAVLAEPVASSLEQFAPDFLIEAGRTLLSHTGPSPRNNYPLGSSLDDNDSDEITCGPAAAAGELLQLEP